MKGQRLVLLFGIVVIVLGLWAISMSWEAGYVAPTVVNYKNLLAEQTRLSQEAVGLDGRQVEINWIHRKVACDQLGYIYASLSIAKRRSVQPPDCGVQFDYLPELSIYKEKTYSAWEREYVSDLKTRRVVRGLF